VQDAEFPADPYPGAVPQCSFVHARAVSHRLDPDPAARSGWRVGRTDLDAWLAGRGAPPVAARVPVLAYGSNRCPSKITWLRGELGLTGPVVVLRACTTGVSAVWAHGLRARDGQRPAVLAAAGRQHVEEHCVWLATPDQITVLDRCEGRGERHRLARLHTGTVTVEDGTAIEGAWCYVGHGSARRPLCVEGRPVRCRDLAQLDARTLVGEPGLDGLTAPTVHGAPHPDQWPAALLVAGVLVPLVDPVPELTRLDAHLGPDHVRIRRTLGDGTACWVYAWRGSTDQIP